jgi:histidinol-phosphate aminotransferase
MESLRRIAEAARESGTLFIVDEAYYPFWNETAVALTREFDNAVVLRSFSKAGGIAGLRLGCLAAHPDIVDGVHRIRGAHEVNAIAITTACYLLDHPEVMKECVDEVEAGRRVLEEAARRLPIKVPFCPTNFQLVRLPGFEGTDWVVDALKSKGYLVRGAFNSPGLTDCIRVTLGGEKVMEGFVAVLESVLVEAK